MHTATRGTIGADHAKQSPKYFDRQNQQIDRKEYSEPNASSSLLQWSTRIYVLQSEDGLRKSKAPVIQDQK